MRGPDLLRLATGCIAFHRGRSGLTALGIAVGIAAVVLLTSIGEGVQQYVVAEFTQFGTNLIGINPGRATTFGGSVGVFGSVRPLDLEDSRALLRIPGTVAVVPVLQGNAEVATAERRRRVTVYGVGPEFPRAFRFRVASGRFLPADNPQSPRPLAVLGSKLRRELFGERNPLGARIRVGGSRYRVAGVMEAKGQVLGFDLDDTAYIPAARALELFRREGLMEIDVLYRAGADPGEVVADIRRLLIARHGREDFTITTQQQMLDVLGAILDVLTFAVAALGGISLLVGGVGILTIMTIAVAERTAEVGLLRALGAGQGQVLGLFLAEAALLAGLGGAAGLALGVGAARLLQLIVPALPVYTPWSYAVAAEAVAIGIGLAAGALPAWRAARLDPVTALRAE